MKIVEQQARSIIVESGLPDTEYVVNPYTGCSFACSYCYASFMGRFVGETRDSWGDYLYVKTNAVDLFRKEIASPRFRSPAPTLFISSVTDAWQGVEKKYRLARGILEILVNADYQGRVSILTKSPLLLRDIDLLCRLARPEVGVTITTDEDEVGMVYEGRAPRNSSRLEILRLLVEHGVPTYAFVGPLMTHYVDRPQAMDRLMSSIADAGVKFIYAELLNVAPSLLRRFRKTLSGTEAEVEQFVSEQLDRQRRRALAELVADLARKYHVELRLGRVLDHAEDRRRRIKSLQLPALPAG